jgi:hypothetical protein
MTSMQTNVNRGRDPNRMRMRGPHPAPVYPYPLAVYPIPMCGYPYVSGTGRDNGRRRDDGDWGRWRRRTHGNSQVDVLGRYEEDGHQKRSDKERVFAFHLGNPGASSACGAPFDMTAYRPNCCISRCSSLGFGSMDRHCVRTLDEYSGSEIWRPAGFETSKTRG